MLFAHNNFDFKIIKRGNICNHDIEYVTVEILRSKDKNIIFSCIYRPPRCISQTFLGNRKVLVNKFKGQKKQIFLASDFDINSLDCSQNNSL